MKRFIFISLLLSFFGFSSVFAYDVCSPYHPYNNPNPALPCSYNGYDYDSLAVEAGVNSFFYKGSEYTLFDYDWWWSLVSQTNETCDGLMVAWGNYSCSHNLSFNKSGALFFGLGASYGINPDTLTIIIEPLDGGNVEMDGIACATCPCVYNLSEVNQSNIHATANEDFAFGYWKEITNPYSITPNGNKTITAKFFRTFRDATDPEGDGFKQSSGYYGECLEYVEYETELPDDVCTYSAVNCLGQASMKGYATGSTPRIGAIVIYNQGGGAMNNGHAGIVESINEGAGTMIVHESNWEGDGYVHNTRSTSINNTGIMGYIYPTP